MILATSSETEILSLISEWPYYSVQITPPSVADKTLKEIRSVVTENAVSIRGWDVPHTADRETFTGDSYVFGIVNWGRHRELWRAYPSGQFVYLGNIWDVDPGTQARLMDEIKREIVTASDAQKQSVAGAISFVGMIYSFTEFYLFAARLSSTIEPAGVMRVRIVMHGVERWALAAGDPGVIWHSFYQSQVPEITSDAKVPSVELVGDPLAKARLALREVFAKFNWYDVADGTIAAWQDKIVKGRF